MKIPIAVQDMGVQHIGEIVLSEVEIHDAQRDGARGLHLMVRARILKIIDAKHNEARMPGALAFRRALQGCE